MHTILLLLLASGKGHLSARRPKGVLIVVTHHRYWDQSKVEVNIAKQKNPLIGKIVSCARMVGPNAPGETCNIVIDHEGTFCLFV